MKGEPRPVDRAPLPARGARAAGRSPRIPARGVILGTLLVLAPPLSGRQEPPPPEVPIPIEPGPVLPAPRIERRPQEPVVEEGGRYVVNFDQSQQEGVTLEEFVKICQRTTGRNFTYKADTEQTLKTNRIRLLGPKEIPKERFYAFFQTIMRIYDFVCVEAGPKGMEVIVLMWLKGPDRTTLRTTATYIFPDEIEEYGDRSGTLVTALVPLRYIQAQQAANSLRPYFPDQQLESITAVGGSNSVLITGFGPTVRSISRLLELVDVAQEEPQPEFEVLPIEHASAQEIEPFVRELVQQRRRGFAGGAAAAARGPVEGVTAAIQPTGGEEARILADTRTNSLLVYAMAAEMAAIKEIVARIDTPVFAPDSNFHVYQVKNVKAGDLEQKLRQFLQETQQSIQQQAAAGRGAGAGTTVSQTASEQRPTIVADPETNSLLVSAGKTKWEEIRLLVEGLDKRQPQVLIETALVELTSDDTTSLGIELSSVTLPEGNERRPFGFTNFGLSTLQDTDGDGIPDTKVPTFGTGVTGGILDGEDFAIPVLLQALRTRTDANILSIPSVLVNNNQEARINSKDEVPTAQVTGVAVPGVSPTQSFGGYQEAGVALSISPSISAANYLRLYVELTVSKFTAPPSTEASPIPPPKITRTVQTQVHLPSGSTMVVGGIVVDDATRRKTSIPILGDIPILSYLFGSRSQSATKTTLYFFVTPHILRDEDFADLAEISYEKKVDAVRHVGEDKFRQVDRTFRPIEPGAESGAPPVDAGAFDIPLYRAVRPGESAPPGEGRPETRPSSPPPKGSP